MHFDCVKHYEEPCASCLDPSDQSSKSSTRCMYPLRPACVSIAAVNAARDLKAVHFSSPWRTSTHSRHSSVLSLRHACSRSDVYTQQKSNSDRISNKLSPPSEYVTYEECMFNINIILQRPVQLCIRKFVFLLLAVFVDTQHKRIKSTLQQNIH
jgi:hypothetical protein